MLVILHSGLCLANIQPNIQLSVIDSNQYGSMLSAHLSNYFNQRLAGMFLISGGEKEFQLGLSLGYQLTQHNRLRLELTHLAQRPELSFSSFPTNNWSGQPAIGITYQRLLTNSYLTGLDLFSYYATARSTNLRSIPYTVDNQSLNNIRRIGGSKLVGFGSGITTHPWPNASLELAVQYDNLHFKTYYEPANDAAGIGMSGRFKQQLPANLSLTALSAVRKIFKQYQINLAWTHHSKQQRALAIGIYGSQLFSHYLPAKRDDRLGLYVNYSFGSPTSTEETDSPSLIDWVQHNHAALPGVFVQRDQRIQ